MIGGGAAPQSGRVLAVLGYRTPMEYSGSRERRIPPGRNREVRVRVAVIRLEEMRRL